MAQIDQQDWNKKVGQITAKAWTDDAFKKRLLSDPTNVLQECGLPIPSGVEIKMTEDTDTLIHLSLPSRPNEAELSEEDLAAVAAGAETSGVCGRDPAPTGPVIIEGCPAPKPVPSCFACRLTGF